MAEGRAPMGRGSLSMTLESLATPEGGDQPVGLHLTICVQRRDPGGIRDGLAGTPALRAQRHPSAPPEILSSNIV